MTSCSKVASVVSKITLLGYRGVSEFTVQRGSVALSGEEAGDGVPVVLLHGLTATRRYVVMGSRALERSGHRVVAYDARGHGRSTPAPGARRLRLRGARRRPARRARRPRDRRAPCSPAPRWARTRSSGWRSTTATASPGSSLVTPAYTPEGDHADLARWDALVRRACATAAWRASWPPTATPACPTRGATPSSACCTSGSPRTSTRTRSPTRCAPSRARARSRTGTSWASSTCPRVVVASRDEADPGHPYAVGERYAEAIPGAELRSEEPGASPLAWQGGQLSKVIAGLAAPRHALSGSIRAISGSAHSTTVSRS